jgi:hypothetical protein
MYIFKTRKAVSDRLDDTIWTKSVTICPPPAAYPREEKMPRTKSEAERAPALAKQYRAIGPAAIVAALMALKKRKPAPQPVVKAA